MKTISVNFTKDQLSVIDKALQQSPYYAAAPLISHINAEIQRNHNEQADARDDRSGQVSPPDSSHGD